MKGKSKRYPTGSMEHANWQQFKALLRNDGHYPIPAQIRRRVRESVEPMREHAALVESNRQNEYAARLWKSHAEDATKQLKLLGLCSQILRAAVLGLEVGNPDKQGDYLKLISEVADDLESMASVG